VTLADGCERPISYLRVSVTDRCNLRCLYCMPPEGVPLRSHDETLRYEEIDRVVRAAAGLGISKVRLTGGEPLARAGIANLVSMLARIPGVDDLSMTTNGTLLARYARALRAAGLKRVNVSLDTLREERFARITRGGKLADALEGIEAAREAGLAPIKVNSVILRGLNEDEIVDLAGLTVTHDWHVRFIELMPLNHVALGPEQAHVPNEEVRQTIVSSLGDLLPAQPIHGSGPAAYYRLAGARGTIGFISPVSEHFCGHCNRLRLTADGRLRPCLLADSELDVRSALRSGASIDEIQALLRQAILAKPTQHRLGEHILLRGRVMSQIGG
jgi:cyclic pyranopterin phosphate synthase